MDLTRTRPAPEMPRSLGSGRFTLGACLGTGAFGAVFEAQDHERRALVALKLLREVDGAGLYRFKQEFRALQDLGHPNLVTLYELLQDEPWVFFTMERVRGVGLDRYLQAQRAGAEGSGGTPFIERLCGALAQLAAGLQVLHDAGRLHRDIKPGNVLVTDEERVVLLDFGLALDLATADGDDEVVGTPAYMSPEQAMALPVGPASDWYSVGVLLYEACSGRPPFSGGQAEQLRRKLREDPPAPSGLAPGVPPEIDALCADLLRRDPAARPSGEEIVWRLERLRAGLPAPARARPLPAGDTPLFGRERHLAALGEALAMAGGGPSVVLCHGRSGMGKSALCQAFLQRLRREEGALVLSARCYEREALPFKALDGIVDALGRWLRGLADAEIAPLLPRDAALLGRLFPVLADVPAIARSPARALGEAQDERRAAFGALRELLRRLAAGRRLVLFIDDLQWGDLDSVDLLVAVLAGAPGSAGSAGPAAPALLLCVAYRSDEEAKSPVLGAFRAGLRAAGAAARELAVEELAKEEAAAVARRLLAPAGLGALGPTLAAESRGSPFFLRELCRHALATSPAGAEDGTAARPPTVEALLEERVARLDPGARRLLTLTCLAGGPLRRPVAIAAAGPPGEGPDLDEPRALARLRAEHLLRVETPGERGSAPEDLVPYHDRVRDAVRSLLSPADAVVLHRRLALALEASGAAQPEQLLYHLRRGGEPAAAARHAAAAAAEAYRALAFDRAARLCREALDLLPPGAPERRRSEAMLGDALAAAGRPREAAEAYREAARAADPREGRRLRRLAMEQLLRGGYLDEGRRLLGELLSGVGIRLPRTRTGAVLSLVGARLRLRLRGLRFRPRPAAAIPPAELERVETCRAAASALAPVDPLRATAFQALHVVLALRAGEPAQVALALAWEGLWASRLGGARSDEILARAAALAEEVGEPRVRAVTLVCAGMAAVGRGRYRRSEEVLRQALGILEGCTGVTWERATCHLFQIQCLFQLGELAALQALAGPLQREAQERGDRYLETLVQVLGGAWAAISQDRAGDVDERVAEALRRWGQPGFHVHDFYALSTRASAALYQGDGERAWQIILSQRSALSRSGLLRIEGVRVNADYLLGLSALAARGRAREREAAAAARRLAARGQGRALALTLRAALAGRRGARAEALALWRAAAEALEAAELLGRAACARRRLGELLGGDEGRGLVEEADRWLAAHGVLRPERSADALAPPAC